MNAIVKKEKTWYAWKNIDGYIINLGMQNGLYAYQVFKQGEGFIKNSGTKYFTESIASFEAQEFVKSLISPERDLRYKTVRGIEVLVETVDDCEIYYSTHILSLKPSK